MAYFKINDVDFSHCVNELKVDKTANYTAQTNAMGNTVVDLINHKRQIEVGIIPLNESQMVELMAQIEQFSVNLTFLNPVDNALAQNVACIIPESNVEYYTIQSGKTLFKAFNLKFMEL